MDFRVSGFEKILAFLVGGEGKGRRLVEVCIAATALSHGMAGRGSGDSLEMEIIDGREFFWVWVFFFYVFR
ncbi:hypothetical protein CASFOL_017594 [Castilleja foliolosa]|uniref:Uncharacterized protein n=1 Tax=Castilleja foliolosa TaxID=1961234 RepID=A0ABD3D7Z0_9LAMI